jgi:hypothetical protein
VSIGAVRHDFGDSLAEGLADIGEAFKPALILDCIMQQCGNRPWFSSAPFSSAIAVTANRCET